MRMIFSTKRSLDLNCLSFDLLGLRSPPYGEGKFG